MTRFFVHAIRRLPLLTVIVLTASATRATGVQVSRASAQRSEVVVGRNVQVSGDFASINHHEVVIAAHPTRPTLLACSMLGDHDGRAVNSVAYRSFDGGAHWSLAAVADEHFADDPSCAFGPDGTAYFVTKTNTGIDMIPGASSDTDSLHVRRSRDDARSWDAVLHGPHANDRPFIAVDTTRGPRHGALYVAFDDHLHAEEGGHRNADFRHALVLAASADRGATFPVSSARGLLDQHADTQAASLAAGVVVLSDGSVVTLQHHLKLGANNAGTGKLREVGGWLQVFRSRDGAHSLDPASRIATVVTGYNAPWSRGVTGSIAADPGSARRRDALYVVWTDFSSGHGVIRLTRSVDMGKSWSVPVAIGNDESPRAAEDSSDSFMPTVAVNRDGVVGVMWYDRRRHAGTSAYDVRFAASTDGGVTWGRSRQLSESPNDERQQRRAAEATDSVPTRTAAGAWRPARGRFSVTGGDTAGLVADATGRFHALWVDNRTGVQQVWTATVDVRLQ